MERVLSYPGSKWSYAEWICGYMPEHKHYLEPFFGSGAVFFSKRPSIYETINDLDKQVVNLFRVIRENPEALAYLVNMKPYARAEFEAVIESRAGQEIQLTDDEIENARRFLVRCNQGRGTVADRTGWKNTKKSNGPNCPKRWSELPKNILSAAARLKNAQIESTDAIELIIAHNQSDCLIYADPPYFTERKRLYRQEMMQGEEHEKLLSALIKHSGPVILSGYDNDLYNEMLSGWNKETKSGRADSGGKRVETIWMNFDTQCRVF